VILRKIINIEEFMCNETIQTGMKRFKCDTIQRIVSWFIKSQKLWWIVSVCDELIQSAKR